MAGIVENPTGKKEKFLFPVDKKGEHQLLLDDQNCIGIVLGGGDECRLFEECINLDNLIENNC